LLPYPELAYLTHSNTNSTPNNYDKQKDPLGLIEKIIDSVENFAASVNDDEKNNALSLSLILAIKTGKLRYHTIIIITINNNHYQKFHIESNITALIETKL